MTTTCMRSASISDHEQRRVGQHIARAEQAARARPSRVLGRLQRLVRALLLDELASYRREARFPRNEVCREPTPLFVDAHGTRCAMAHLLELGGERALVEKIRTTRNRARIAELADEPRLLSWLAAAGLSVAEAAAIQPSYCFEGPPMCVCSVGASTSDETSRVVTIIEGKLDRKSSDGGTAFVQISKVHGAPGSFAVGDTISAHSNGITAQQDVSLTVLIPLRTKAAASDEREAFPLYDEEFECRGIGGGGRSLDKERFIAALLSADCPRTLRSYGPQWKRQPCDSDPGCATHPGPHGDVLGSAMILLSLLATMSLRRLRSLRA